METINSIYTNIQISYFLFCHESFHHFKSFINIHSIINIHQVEFNSFFNFFCAYSGEMILFLYIKEPFNLEILKSEELIVKFKKDIVSRPLPFDLTLKNASCIIFPTLNSSTLDVSIRSRRFRLSFRFFFRKREKVSIKLKHVAIGHLLWIF